MGNIMQVRYIGCGGHRFEWYGIVYGGVYTVVDFSHSHGDNFYKLSGINAWLEAEFFKKV
jgi:hypothetical protein